MIWAEGRFIIEMILGLLGVEKKFLDRLCVYSSRLAISNRDLIINQHISSKQMSVYALLFSLILLRFGGGRVQCFRFLPDKSSSYLFFLYEPSRHSRFLRIRYLNLYVQANQ